ncbi:MAG TPA: aspartate carbamoyltransferase catalytic subunit [Rubricoccaceae bacterium]|jgi:aspartate carbamoyltransferase catalytic subunit
MSAPDLMPAARLASRHLLGLAGMPAPEIRLLLQTARTFRDILDRPIKRVPSLRGVTVCNLFFENSTRTRLSFELAEKRLSADTMSFTSATSSVTKGETLRDTARNIEAMKVDVAVIRHRSAGAAHFLTRCIEGVVVNAGDGQHEHPTQGLLDALTVSDLAVSHLAAPGGGGLSAFDFRGLRVAIIGDIAASRVARSNVYALCALGAHVTLCGPRTMMPLGIDALADGLDVRITDSLDDALDGCDVAMTLRIQLERQASGAAPLLPSLREYHARYGLRGEHLDRHPDLFVMHPGPVNLGVELAGEVAESDRAVILDQVTNGVAVRMAVLYLLTGGEAEAA